MIFGVVSGTSHRSSDILRSGSLCLFTAFGDSIMAAGWELDVQRNDETEHTD